MRRVIDITDQRFGRLTAIEIVGKSSRGEMCWRCECDCGGEIIATVSNIRVHLKGCGCVHRERAFQFRRTHGLSKSKLYGVWCGMKQRISDPDHISFRWYGERGITVCAEWQQFEPFRDWALANGYAEGLQLDRRDNDEGYEPKNCRWATPVEQANNRRPRAKAA